MQLSTIFLALTTACLASAQSCDTPSGSGTCQSTSSCSTFSVAGYCSGGSDTQCCVQRSCSAGGGTGTCRSTSNGCSGQFYSGACPGDSSIQCCVTSSGGGGAGFPAIDISVGQSSSFWSCAKNSNQKVVIRGYRQACSYGGQVDSALLGSYRAARNAGLSNIDIYFFPCTGTQPTGVACKSPSTQVSEIESYLSNNGISVGTIWLDLEPTSGDCNAFNQGTTTNTNVARQFASLARNSQYRWGVYANANQWSGMFGSRDTNIASDLPFWAVQADGTSGVNTVTRFCGGWTTAEAKQYRLDTTQCGGSVDLNSFLR